MEAGTTAATGALIKLFGVPVITGSAATALGFMFLWPNSPKEAAVRIGSTILSSAICGPALVSVMHSAWPSLFTGARETALMYGTDPAQAFLFVAAPLMVAAGLPAWWVVGAIVRWLDKRKNKDIGELAADFRELAKQVKGQA
jgi:hypothetical protein